MTIHSKLRDFGLFDSRVPRYTSYPTAPHFKNSVLPEMVARWLAAIKPDSQISTYLHVPFCRRLCWFCACRTQGTATLSPVNAYVDSLKRELDVVSEHIQNGAKTKHLHFGGGTPTILPAPAFADLAAAVKARLPLTKDAQFSVEIDPNEIDDTRLDALAAAGMNRASIGVQDFDELIQDTIGRHQSFETTKSAVDGIRARGIDSLNMDILYGLPYQTRARMLATVEKVIDLSPDRIAVYGYAHVPQIAKRQSLIPTGGLPTPQERLDLFELADELFRKAGYHQIGIDHFAKPEDGLAKAAENGTLRRNFQGYTEDTADTLLGLGASAISRFPQGYAQNNPGTSAYQKAVRSAELATSRGHEFRGEDILRGRLIESLMCDFSFDASAIALETDANLDEIADMARDVADHFETLTTFDDDRFEILEHAKPLTRIIARHFDAYAVNPKGHSSAI